MSSSTYFDIILTLPILWGIYRGFRKGFIIELASLIALALGIYGAIKFSGYASDLLSSKFELTGKHLPLISFAVTFIIIVIAIHLLAKLIESIVNIASLKLINKIAGAVFGLLKTAVIVFVFLFILKSTDEKFKWIPEDIKNESVFFKLMEKTTYFNSIFVKINQRIR